jgi:ribosomal protein L11 methyltransferase
MEYIEISCTLPPDEGMQELLMARLDEIGCESFVESEEGLLGYIQKSLFDEQAIKDVFSEDLFKTIPHKITLIAETNWNAEWESNYPCVLIADRCMVRAPFHKKDTTAEFDIVIEPKMSFGTAHHETTSQMIELLLDEDVKGMTMLDMGSGTGVLAILAWMKGAKEVTAIDNDQWAYENAVENLQRNNVPADNVLLGNAETIIGKKYQLILANINRNILLNDMHYYREALEKNSKLFMSGFYEADLPAITAEAARLGMRYVKHLSRNNWVAAVFTR